MNNEIKYNKIYSKIKEAKNILLLTHEKPDVDAVSSVCAMIDLLEKENKPYFAYCYDAMPHQFNFLPHIEKINSDKSAFSFNDFDLIIVFDCGGMNRTKLADEIIARDKNQFIIEIDHHIKIEDYADLELRNPKVASTTTLVYDFFRANKIKINKNIANCILAGILTDSGNFIFTATTDNTIKISSEMLKLGANLPQIMENTIRNKNLHALKIWGKAMARTQINKKYNIAFTVLTLNDVKELEEEDLEGIPNFLGTLHDVKAVMLIREQKDGTIKGSFRSAHPKINVATLAQTLGGGGHAKASGFTIEGRLKLMEKGWRII
jgi:phosphoesterase RecJ-like protein